MSTDNRVQTAARPLLGVALMALGVGILPRGGSDVTGALA